MTGSRRCWKQRCRGKRFVPARIRFKDAVPSRRDRAELRRRLRTVAPVGRAIEKWEVIGALRWLAERRVHVASIGDRATLWNELVELEFVDGTQALLDVRKGIVSLQRFARGSTGNTTYLAHVRPCFGHRRYRLRFVAGRDGPFTVFAEVVRFGPPLTPSDRPPRR